MEDYDYLVKLIIVGDVSVGKSSLVNRFCEGVYDDNLACTMGVDFQIKSLMVGGKKFKMHIWDTAGQERFRSITMSYYRGAQAVLLIFDLTNPNSFTTLNKWLYDLDNNILDSNYKIILVGNKSDLPAKINKEDINKFVNDNKMVYIECSAKNDINVNNLFTKIIELVSASGTVRDTKGQYIKLSSGSVKLKKDTYTKNLVDKNINMSCC